MLLEYLMDAAPYDFTKMPTKRMTAGAIFLNAIGNILIVKPPYRPDWLIPGGTIEADESPKTACMREIKEEALTLLSSRLARTVPHCLLALQENGTVYLEDGSRIY